MDLNTTPVEKHLLALLEIAVVDNKGLLIWKERFLSFWVGFILLGEMPAVLKIDRIKFDLSTFTQAPLLVSLEIF